MRRSSSANGSAEDWALPPCCSRQGWDTAFRNLNQAIEALYIMCEVDMSVVHSGFAAHVLAQASSDFMELQHRVMHQLRFEHHLQDSQSDFATIAWEVRSFKKDYSRNVPNSAPGSINSSMQGCAQSHGDVGAARLTAEELGHVSLASEAAVRADRGCGRSQMRLKLDLSVLEHDRRRPSTAPLTGPRSPGSRSSSPDAALRWEAACGGGGARNLHQKLLSPERMKKAPAELRRLAVEKQMRAEALRQQLEAERRAKIVKAKQDREALLSSQGEVQQVKLQEQLTRHQRSAERRNRHITGIVQRATDESHKVKEVLFIKELEKEDSKHVLDERLEKGEARRAEALAARQYRKGGVAVDCVLGEAQERRKALERERMEELYKKQRRKEEAAAKFEEARRAAAAAKEEAKNAKQQEKNQLLHEKMRQEQTRAEELAKQIENRLKSASARRLRYFNLIRERTGTSLFRGSPDDTGSFFIPPPRLEPFPPPEEAAPPSPGSQRGHAPVPLPWTHLVMRHRAPGSAPPPQAEAKLYNSLMKKLRRKAAKLRKRLAGGGDSFAEAPWFAEEARRPENVHCLMRCYELREEVMQAAQAQDKTGVRIAIRQVAIQIEGRAFRGDDLPPSGAASCLDSPLAADADERGERVARNAHDSAALAGRGDGGGGRARVGSFFPHAARASGLLDEIIAVVTTAGYSWPEQLRLQTLATWHALMHCPANCDYVLARNRLQAVVDQLMTQLDLTLASGSECPVVVPTLGKPGPDPPTPRNISDGAFAPQQQPTAPPPHSSLADNASSSADSRLDAAGLALCEDADMALEGGQAARPAPDDSSPRSTAPARSGDSVTSDAAPSLAVASVDAPPSAEGVDPLRAATASASSCQGDPSTEQIWRDGLPRTDLLEAYLSLLVTSLDCAPASERLLALRSDLLSYVLACGIVYRITQLFSFFDRNTGESAPIPFCVEHCLLLLDVLTAPTEMEPKRSRGPPYEIAETAVLQGTSAHVLTVFRETSLVGLTSLLTSVLLHASTDPQEVESVTLPHNFLNVAWGVLRVLNNACIISLPATQALLGSTQLRVEVLHLLAFLLSYCTKRCDGGRHLDWTAAGGRLPWSQARRGRHVEVVEVLNEAVLCVGFFALLNPSNQEKLHWGNKPSLLQRLCTLPSAYFVDPSLTQVTFPTLMAVCFQNKRVCEVVADHISVEMIVRYIEDSSSSSPRHPLGPELENPRYHLHHRFPVDLLPDALAFFQTLTLQSRTTE